MEESKVNQEVVEEKDPVEIWSDISKQADLEVTELQSEESSGGGSILLILGGIAAIGGLAYGVRKLVKKVRKKEQTPSDVIDGEAVEVKEEAEEDAEAAKPGGKASDMDPEEKKDN